MACRRTENATQRLAAQRAHQDGGDFVELGRDLFVGPVADTQLAFVRQMCALTFRPDRREFRRIERRRSVSCMPAFPLIEVGDLARAVVGRLALAR